MILFPVLVAAQFLGWQLFFELADLGVPGLLLYAVYIINWALLFYAMREAMENALEELG